MTRATAIDDDIMSAESFARQHEFFHRLRAHDPVHYSRASRAWIITSYAEVSSAFRDQRLSSARLPALQARMTEPERAAMAQAFELLRGWMVFNDPPVHGQLRTPVRKAFTRRSVDRISDRIQAIVDQLLDDMAATPTCDLIAAFAHPLPAIVIAELLGVPPRDRERFKTWSSQLAALVFGALERPRHEPASHAAAEFVDYFSELIAHYRAHPGDNLISALVAAHDDEDGLTTDQLVGACTMLLFGGHETTTNLIGNSVATLARHPGERARLRRDPALASSAVEELLRFAGPARVMIRDVVVDHERGGHRLEAGQRVYLSMAGANRDPAVFPEPDRLDLSRDPNPHLGFGQGLHLCLGAWLARVETRIALTSLYCRFPALKLAGDPVCWNAALTGRQIVELPVTLR